MRSELQKLWKTEDYWAVWLGLGIVLLGATLPLTPIFNAGTIAFLQATIVAVCTWLTIFFAASIIMTLVSFRPQADWVGKVITPIRTCVQGLVSCVFCVSGSPLDSQTFLPLVSNRSGRSPSVWR